MEGVEEGLTSFFAEAAFLGGGFTIRILGWVEHEVGQVIEVEFEKVEGSGGKSGFD